MSQQFCLKWNNHMNNMMDVFKNLLNTESMVDVTLACDGLSLKAHKMVLSACSPFFQSLFLENPCKHPIVILKDMKYTELKAIIEFMYHGEVNVAQEQLSALMKTAETLRVKGLAEMPNEKNSSSTQDEPSHRSVPRTETPPPSKRRRGRVRKRSLSDSNRSDDSNDHKIKQPHSPDIEELSGDVTMDNTSGQFSNLQSQVPMQSLPSHSNSYQKTVVSQDPQIEEPASADESEFGVEPAKLLEQTLTTDDLQNRRSSRSAMSSSMEMQRRPRSSTDHSSNLVPASMSSDTSLSANQQPESPPDIKPELLELDPPMSPVAGPSHSTDNSMMMYMDQSSVSSHPGTSFQDNTALVPQDSQPQGGCGLAENHSLLPSLLKNPYVLVENLDCILTAKNTVDDPKVSKEINSSIYQRNDSNNKRLSGRKKVSKKISKEGSEVENRNLVRTPSKKNCFYCHSRGVNSRTFWLCKCCGHYICKPRPGKSCFEFIHSLEFKNLQRNHLQNSIQTSKACSSKSPDPKPVSKESCLSHNSGSTTAALKKSKVTPSPSKVLDSEQVSEISLSTLKTPNCDTSSKMSSSSFKTLDSSKTNLNVSRLPHKAPGFRHNSGSSPILKKSKSSNPSNEDSPWGYQHILVSVRHKKPCYHCLTPCSSICKTCQFHFCNVNRTGRECFFAHHAASKLSSLDQTSEKIAAVEDCSNDMDDDNSDIRSPAREDLSGANKEQILDKESSDIEVISETVNVD